MPPKLPRYVRVKRAKGKTYYYFDTGQVSEAGKPIYKRLPDLKAPNFIRACAMAQAARDRRDTTPHVLTVAGLIDLYEKSPKFRKLAPASQALYHIYLARVRELLGIAFANEVKPADVQTMRDRHLSETPSAANAFVKVVGALYQWGRALRHVTAEPTRGIELFDEGEHDPWPDDLVTDALASDDDLVRRAVALLYYTGQRIGDVCAMRWTDCRQGWIEIVQQKTRKPVHIPVHRDLAAILAFTPAGLTILARDGKPLSVQTLRRALQQWAKAKGSAVVPHGLRKNAVNALLEAGCSAAETAAISGQTLQMVEHYAKRRNVRHLASAAILKWEKRGGNK